MPTESQVHFNREYLQEDMRQLAGLQQTHKESKSTRSIEPLLTDAKETLVETYRVLAKAAKQNRELSSAGEWLIDNFYIVQEQIVQLKEDLPESYYRKLPKLMEGEYRGFPRTYEIVQRLAAISDNILDQDNTTVAIRAYQQEDILDLGEMWSVPLMIRLALIIRLAERSKKLLQDRRIQDEIEQVLNQHLANEVEEPGFVLRKLSDIVDNKRDTIRFLVILSQRLQNRGMLTETERRWFNYKFSKWDTNLEEQLHSRTQTTSRLHLSIQNAISSLRVASETDWSHFVEDCSIVDHILRLDPADMYQQMDFSTRDRYRKRVEQLSECSEYTEQDVAEKALLMAESSAQNGTSDKSKKVHIGYYLVGDGYEKLADNLAYKRPFREWLLQKAERHPLFYFSMISLHLFVLIGIVALFTNFFMYQGWLIGVTILATFFPALELSIVSTNRILSFVVPPRIMPKLEFKTDIPDEYRTVVIVPTLLSSVEDVRAQFELLEIRALANANQSLQFILLSDFHDAPLQTMESDQALLDEAHRQVNRLNLQYNSRYGDKFLFFHRKRLWNASEDSWMGWERKRGKIEEFNHLLINSSAETSFTTVNEDFLQTLQKFPVTFVITLDADTQIPPGSARTIIGAAAHPLNRAEVDESGRFVEKGYAIFQPRISIPPKSANQSLFSRIFSGNVGLDPYTTAVSDIYQDLFGEGIFTGKGLYDLQVFEQVLGDKFPEDAILSHDLLESTYLRTALLTDIEFFDDYPSNYLSYSKRNHRWMRGDWQILHWLLSKVPVRGDAKEKNPLNTVSKWKVFDNLRRSLNPPFLILFLLAGWVVLPGSAIVWTVAAFGIISFPIYSSLSIDIFRRPERVGWKLYLEKIRADLYTNTIQSVTSFLFLPHQAYLSLDAVVRTLYRMFVSGKKMLEWTTSTKVDIHHTNGTLADYAIQMWFNSVWAILSLVSVAIFKPVFLIVAGPIGLAWMLSPAVAYYLAKPPPDSEAAQLTMGDRKEVRGFARRTWHFFEQYMDEEQSWLPPDNVQEDPYVGPVARTSPTNMGLALVSTCVASEMGYLTYSDMIDRLQKTLKSMQELDRFQGHFYNWYSTKLGDVLNPNYISTVDSGNLAGSLIVVQQVLEQIPKKEWPNPKFWDGLNDTLLVIQELFESLKNDDEYNELYQQVSDQITLIQSRVPAKVPDEINQWQTILKELRTVTGSLVDIDLSVLRLELEDHKYQEWKDWCSRPYRTVCSQLREIESHISSRVRVGNRSSSTSMKYIPAFADTVMRAGELARICRTLIHEMDFTLLYDDDRELFSIGYNVDRASKDKSYYDLLASEARLASFIAIAKGEIPPEHWFRLSRRLTSIEQSEILLSWGGTMFEYLMPLLFMSRFDKTLLSNTYDNVVNWQKNYGALRDRPWGFSESGYGMLNLDLHYQYRAFGVPGLGLRRGLAEDYVVSPYAGMLAMMVQPREALNNLRILKKEGVYGANGFYEAIDYTTNGANGREATEKQIVKMYMAHHQGMSLLAMANILSDNWVQRHFHHHPLVRSCELLLQERIPRGIPIKEPRPIDVELEPAEEETSRDVVDHAGIEDLTNSPPRTHILSNGELSTLISHSGTGYSFSKDLTLTRWRADVVTDQHGMFFYVRDLDNGSYWSIGHQPVQRNPDRYDSWFHAGKVQIARVDDWIESFMEVCVSPEDNIELRKITLTNYSNRKRRIELTSYAEVVLNTQQADRSHPAFSNLFVQSEYIHEHHSVLAKRRPRGENDVPLWLVHTIASDNLESEMDNLQVETDREQFIGRNRSLRNPRAMADRKNLSGTVGNVKDPIVSLRREVTLDPGEKKEITFGLGIAYSREDAVAMGDRYDNPYATDRVFELASIYGGVELDQIGLTNEQAHYFQRLAGYLTYNSQSLRADIDLLARNRKQQSGLWAHSLSGDLPILLYRISDTKYIREVELLLKAHALWRQKGLKVDLVFMNDHPPSYIDELQESIHKQIQLSTERHQFRERGGIFVLRADELNPEDRILIESVAHVVLEGKLPSASQLDKIAQAKEVQTLEPSYQPVDLSKMGIPDYPNGNDLVFDNGFGGFTTSGTEYVIRLKADPKTGKLIYPPAPWINVISNPNFGFITSEKGSGYTWSLNSRENKLTPWSNDAVLDPHGEALYIRDEQQGLYWSPLPGPVAGSPFYEIRHGFGYSTYQSSTLNIVQHVTQWVDSEDPIKLVKLTISNTDLMSRELSIFRYLDWILGINREEATRFVKTSLDSDIQTIFARNHYNNEFAGRVAFSSVYTPHDYELDSFSADRTAFIGRNRSLKNPRSVEQRQQLENHFGVGLESCAASQIVVQLASGKAIDLYFLLGEAKDEKEARRLIEKYHKKSILEQSLQNAKKSWEQKLSRIQVQTPIPEFNILANGWLQYQNIGCRIWARTGFYQAGGAFGYRDQLQDATAACYLTPALTRKQIILHAAHQFVEGDVLHWWHPPSNRGIRSHITDDLLWLPYVTNFYIAHTGDQSVLDEMIPFMTARNLFENEHEAYLQPEQASTSATLYEHCCRALDRSLTSGPHGLPLIGSGDWNDGMNMVGIGGSGESVWLGFFLYHILSDFIPYCKLQGDQEHVEQYQSYQKQLKHHLNHEGWDKDWYLRAYYDDGTPLGSSQNNECKIDAIAQAWSVISGVATPAKARDALKSAEQHLVSEQEGIIRLLTPAFDETDKNPGYIKGYIPGVRENGGQYTHAALWLVKALSHHGNRERAAKLLQMLTPINHAINNTQSKRYHVEPYAVVADIYGEDPLTGMGGWTWYTGSAGWMYRVLLEDILGVQISKGNVLKIDPMISEAWKKYEITLFPFDGKETEYHVLILNPNGQSEGELTAVLDGQEIPVKKGTVTCTMKDDKRRHRLKISLV
jgi:cellobiose phosphorylase